MSGTVNKVDQMAYWREQFIKTEGFAPTEGQVMVYAVGMQELNKQESAFWAGVFGL